MDKKIKERGIIFNGEMVRAILDGRKTQTRRVIKNQREGDCWSVKPTLEPRHSGHTHDWWLPKGTLPYSALPSCPFGKVGDRLWVRETCYATRSTPHGIRAVAYPADNEIKIIEYADQHIEKWETLFNYCNAVAQQVPSILMPRWVSRITLEITDIRVERLNDISQEDAQAEGMGLTGWRPTYSDPDSGGEVKTPYDNFADLWESIYGQDSWQSNPFVWVIEFKRVEAA